MCYRHRFTLLSVSYSFLFFFFNDTATTEIYTLSLHDALPISRRADLRLRLCRVEPLCCQLAHALDEHEGRVALVGMPNRSEEHTSELQSRLHLVCRLLLEKKKKHQSRHLSRRDDAHVKCEIHA